MYCPLFIIRFPDFSWLCCHISEWKLAASFHIKSYRSMTTFVTIHILFHELLAFVQNSFAALFLNMLLHIWMIFGSELPYEELQIKFDLRHSWPTFSWVIFLVQNSFSRLVFAMLSYIWIFPLSVFSATMNLRKILTSNLPSNVPVTYNPAVPMAVLNTALLCIKTRVFHSQTGTILIKYKYRIEFYLFISHGVMKDRGSTCKFRKALRALRNLFMDK